MHVRAFSIVDAVIAMSMGRGIQLLAHVNIAKLCQATAEGIFRQNSILFWWSTSINRHWFHLELSHRDTGGDERIAEVAGDVFVM